MSLHLLDDTHRDKENDAYGFFEALDPRVGLEGKQAIFKSFRIRLSSLY